MNSFHHSLKFIGSAALACFLFVSCSWVSAQQQTQPPKPPPSDDVVRVSTTLVQTDAMVFDKQGKFVAGLKPEQFELKVNGKPISVSFMELVTTGSAEEKAQLEAARRGQPATALGENPTTTVAPPPGRSIFIFVDDFHLDADSFIRMRQALLVTIDKQITATDRALLTTASGQLGPQSLTTDKVALKAVVARLAPRAGTRRPFEKPAMSEYAAIAINRGDSSTLDYYVKQVLKDFPAIGPTAASEQVRSRARFIIDQSAPIASYTLTSLQSFIRQLAPVPGRKLLFFLSDGFILENERSINYSRLHDATQQAASAGVVIYALDTAGLVTTGPDASDGGSLDPRLVRSAFSADSAEQDVLQVLAADTGGRALVNNNDLNSGVRRALEETSKYYLLAWRPPPEMATGEDVKRVEFTIVGHPELKVTTRRALAEAVSQTLVASKALSRSPSASTSLAPAPSSELLTALNSPQTGVPTSLVLVYHNIGSAAFALTASLQFPTAALVFADVDGKQTATVDVAGAVLDQTGKQVHSFSKTVGIAADSNVVDPTRNLVFYNYDIRLAPGIYQIRLGVRDSKSRLIGGTVKMIDIPEIASGKLTLSSLMLNEQLEADDEDAPSQRSEEVKGLTQRFVRGSRLQFLTYVYNAKPVAANDNEPDLNIDVKILRGNQPVLAPALRELLIEDRADSKSYPFAAEIPLEGLEAGEYVLQVTVTDVTTKASATQQTTIIVE
jgi:VWFA-related protein